MIVGGYWSRGSYQLTGLEAFTALGPIFQSTGKSITLALGLILFLSLANCLWFGRYLVGGILFVSLALVKMQFALLAICLIGIIGLIHIYRHKKTVARDLGLFVFGVSSIAIIWGRQVDPGWDAGFITHASYPFFGGGSWGDGIPISFVALKRVYLNMELLNSDDPCT